MNTQLVPEIRFKEFEGEWTLSKAGAYFVNRSEKGNDDLPVLSVIQTSTRIVRRNSQDRDFENAAKASSNKQVHRGDLAYNTMRMWQGAVAIADERGMLSAAYTVLQPKSETSSEFFNYLFRTPPSLYKLWAYSYGITNDRLRLYFKDFSVIPFRVPTLPEQQKIATFLTLVDQRLAAARRREQLLRKYKNALIQQLFSGEISVDGSGTLHGLDFLKGKLKERKERNKGSKYSEVFSVTKGSGVVNQIEHLGRSYASDDISNYKVIHPGDVIYTKSPTSGFPFGIIKQNQTGRTGVVSVLYAVYKPATYELGTMLENYFLSPVRTYNYLVPIVRKGAKNTMNVNNSEFLVARRIPLLDPKVQTHIANILTTLDTRISAAEREVASWETWKRGLLQAMLA